MFKSAHLKVSAVWITLVVSYEVFCNVKMTTFGSNVERSATIRCGSFYFNTLFVRLSGPHTKLSEPHTGGTVVHIQSRVYT